jgi:23S rRNA (adenine2503-C2)-methyltransferase
MVTLMDPPAVLIGQTLPQLEGLVVALGEPRFRAGQLHSWLYVRNVRQFDQMTNLAKSFRTKLADTCMVGTLQVANKQVSEDGTTKYLGRMPEYASRLRGQL